MKGPCLSHFIRQWLVESYLQLFFSVCLSEFKATVSCRRAYVSVLGVSPKEVVQTFGVSVYEGKRSDPWVCSQIPFHQIRAHKHTQQEHRPHVHPCVGSLFVCVCIYLTDAHSRSGFTHFTCTRNLRLNSAC